MIWSAGSRLSCNTAGEKVSFSLRYNLPYISAHLQRLFISYSMYYLLELFQ
jgi:hypothetical protein